MRNAGIQNKTVKLRVVAGEMRVGHVNRYVAPGQHTALHPPHGGMYRTLLADPPAQRGETGHATRAVPAKGCRRTIGIVVLHHHPARRAG